MDILIPKRRSGGKKSKKDRQQSHNKLTGKYVRQRYRTARNKALARKKHLANHPNDLQAIANIQRAIAAADAKLLM